MPVILIVVTVLKHHLTFFISYLYYVQNTGVGCLSLLQGIFPTQGSNPGLLHCKWILYQLSHKGSSLCIRSISIGIYHYIYVSIHTHTHTHTHTYICYMMGTLASSNHILCLYLEYFIVFLLKSYVRWATF